jgi:hypothetical protein
METMARSDEVSGAVGTGIIQGQMDIALFDRDRSGEAQQLASRIRRIDDQIADLRRGIEEEIRKRCSISIRPRIRLLWRNKDRTWRNANSKCRETVFKPEPQTTSRS